MKRSVNLRGHGPADGGLLGKVGLALRELDAARLRVQELEAELDCGQDAVCAKPPGCRRHWEERNRELVEDLRAVSALADELADRGVAFAIANHSWQANVHSEIAAKLRGTLAHLAVYPMVQAPKPPPPGPPAPPEPKNWKPVA
jgi:hypothetical protein